ncbi:MAG: hypothetical protein V4772_00645 [Pseudomonadota bacterium]
MNPIDMKYRATLAVLSATCILCTAAIAQTPPAKTVVSEPTGVVQAAPNNSGNVFFVFGQWMDSLSAPPVPVQLAEPIAPINLTVAGNTPAASFEPAPLILGQPDLPLVGLAASQAARQWNMGLNYQGIRMSYLVVDAAGKRIEARPVSRGLAAGEYFKIRYTSSFAAVTSIDLVAGEVWRGQRLGQAWPQTGMSVQSAAGEVVELPLGGGYFVMSSKPGERYVLSVRHPDAKGPSRSDQPVYRQDGERSSNYLQLLPAGKLPAIEQVLSARSK